METTTAESDTHLGALPGGVDPEPADCDRSCVRDFLSGRGRETSQAAFAAIVARHGPAVRATCLRIVRNPDLADDATQATFVVLTRRAQELGEVLSLPGWLQGVATRVARRLARVDRRGRGRPLAGIDPASRPELPRLDRAEVSEAIAAELDRLPARYREVLSLRYLRGLSQHEVARRLGVPEGTVESRLHRAKSRLRSSLRRRGIAPGAVAVFTRGGVCRGTTGSFRRVVSIEVSRWIRRIAVEKLGWIAALMIGGTAWWVGSTGASPPEFDAPPEAILPASPPLGLASDGPDASLILKWDVAVERFEFTHTSQQLVPELVAAARPHDPLNYRFSGVIGFCGPTNDSRENLEWMAPLARAMIDRAASEPTTDRAFSLALRVAGVYKVAEFDRRFAEPVDRACVLLAEHHASNPKLAGLGRSLRSLRPRASALRLLEARATAPMSPADHGTALFQLGQYLEKTAVYLWIERNAAEWERSHPIEAEFRRRDREDYRRFHIKDAFDPDPTLRAALASTDPASLHRRAMEILDRVVRDHGDIAYPEIGDGTTADLILSGGRTLSTAVGEFLAHREGWAIGAPVPVVRGRDSVGKAVRLDESLGKVVLLVNDASEAARLAAIRPDSRIVVVGRDWTEITVGEPDWAGPLPLGTRPMAMVIDERGELRYWGGITSVLDDILALKSNQTVASVECP